MFEHGAELRRDPHAERLGVIAAALLAVELGRPAALVALILPLAVLVGARLFDRPEEVATGTLDIWERLRAARPPNPGRARRRIPLAVWILALGLSLGAVALAGPRMRAPETTRSFRFLVDVSPSMNLPLAKASRRERALAMALAWLGREQPGARVEWMERPQPFGAEDDEPDAVWVTDRAPIPPPRRAGFFASGGPAVPGPIAVDGSTRFDWDGARIVEVAGGAPKRRVEVHGALPPPIARFLDAWAGARGAVVAAVGDDRPALVFHGAPPSSSGTPATFEAGRDGWTATGAALGSAPSSDGEGPLATWLADASGRALVSTGAGRVHCPWTSMDEPRGDPAAFAVSWAQLLDNSVLPPAGVIELGERLAAGEEASAAPSTAEPSGSSGGAAPPIDAWLAAAALLCTLGALALAADLHRQAHAA
jgi:hypothetical protein